MGESIPKKTDDRKPVTFRMPPDAYSALEKLTSYHSRSKSNEVFFLIEQEARRLGFIGNTQKSPNESRVDTLLYELRTDARLTAALAEKRLKQLESLLATLEPRTKEAADTGRKEDRVIYPHPAAWGGEAAL
jgi:hypothetical protein